TTDYVVGTWLGHASVLVEFKPLSSTVKNKSLYALFDPMFSMRAGPTQYTGPSRFNKPPCSISDLPGCDVVCISHSHFDHLDTSTVLQIIRYFPSAKWFVPLGLQEWFVTTGVKAENVKAMDWWDTWDGFTSKKLIGKASSSFRISCVPAQHNSGRGAFDQGSTLWCGWVIERFVEDAEGRTRHGSIYHAGDTGYRRSAASKDVCPAFKEIGSKFNGFDLSFIPIWRGGSLGFISYIGLRLNHHEIPAQFHCSPADAVLIHKDTKSRNTIAIHFGTFVGSQNE
ncbi:Metallo-hydrolase/oxidoreductase, partial [Rhizodiscina lignyota]